MNRRKTVAKKTPRKRGPRYSMWLPKGTTLSEARLSLALNEPIPHKVKKITKKTTTPPTLRQTKKTAAATSTVVDDNIGTEFDEKVNSKVDGFFKSASLLSSDDEEIDTSRTKPKTSNFSISDSEDDSLIIAGSSTSSIDTNLLNQPSTSKSVNKGVMQKSSSTDESEIMVMVDSVLENVDNNPITDMKSLEEYRKETEEMLKNASSLLEEIKGTKESEKIKENLMDNKEDKEIGASCPICLEPLNNKAKAATFCGHVFCKECIYECAKTLKKCPTCRKPINNKKIHPLFF